MSEIRMKPYNSRYGEEWDRIFGKKPEDGWLSDISELHPETGCPSSSAEDDLRKILDTEPMETLVADSLERNIRISMTR